MNVCYQTEINAWALDQKQYTLLGYYQSLHLCFFLQSFRPSIIDSNSSLLSWIFYSLIIDISENFDLCWKLTNSWSNDSIKILMCWKDHFLPNKHLFFWSSLTRNIWRLKLPGNNLLWGKCEQIKKTQWQGDTSCYSFLY